MTEQTHARSDADWMNAAAAIGARGLPMARPNPAVGALIVRDGRVLARGWTQPGGRPHAEAVAISAMEGSMAGATMYVTLEPCAHASARGPSCSSLLAAARPARVVIGVADPDPRTAGQGMAALREAGIAVDLLNSPAAHASLEGYLMRARHGRPHVTLKLAMSLDGRIALPSGESRWITGAQARAHVHAMRARADAILVGAGTLRTDAPRLDVRLPGLEIRSPDRWVLTHGAAPDGWRAVTDITAQQAFGDAQYLFVEGGAQAAATFIAADMVDRLLLYRAPIVIGAGLPCVGDIGLTDLGAAHDRWRLAHRCMLGSDVLDVYERAR